MHPHRASSKWSLSICIALLALMLPAYNQPVQPAAASTALTFQRLWPTISNNVESPNTVIDYKGGVHMAFSAHTADSSGHYPAYYAYCASGCNDPKNWAVTAAGDLGSMFGEYARLDVDSAGHPRMLWYRENSISEDGFYQYAECNNACTNAANWTVVSLNADPVGPSNSRFFAIDPQGRPRYLYTDTNTDHKGTFYVSCDSGCTNIANWSEVKIDDSYLLYDFDLAYDDSGGISLAFRSAVDTPNTMVYAECASGCSDANNWTGATLVDNFGSGGAFSMRLDSQGRPRIAYYSGYLGSNDPGNNLLYYGWCNSNCTQASSWTLYPLGLPEGHGGSVDLALDAQNRPYLAYNVDDIAASTYGLGYAACSGACETASSTWTAQMVETGDDLDASNPVPKQGNCTLSYWLDVGIDPSIALDAAGQPRIGYTAVHYQGGACTIHEDIRLVRFALSGTSQPPVTGKYKIYLPTTKK